MKSFSDGDALFGPMLNAIISAFQGTSVIDGCEVETSGYWDLRFSVAAGSVQIGGTIVSVAGGSSMLGAASAFERYDLVTITSAGEIHVVQGTEAQKCPAIPANECLIAIIRLPAGSTVINTADVLDARLVGLRLADVAVTGDKNWNGKKIFNVGQIGAKTSLILIGGDQTLFSSSSSATFSSQVYGTGHVKVVVSAPYVISSSGIRTYRVLKNGVEIWTQSQPSVANEEDNKEWGAITWTVAEDLPVVAGDVLVVQRTGGEGTPVMTLYSTPILAPLPVVS